MFTPSQGVSGVIRGYPGKPELRRASGPDRSLTTSRNKASTGKGFDASGVGDSHPDAPYRPRYVGVQDNGNFH